MIWLDSKKKCNIESFDLIGFKGSEFISNSIICIQRRSLHNERFSTKNLPKISHVGLAVHGKDMKPFMEDVLSEFHGKINEQEIYVFESTKSGTSFDQGRDVFSTFFFGVQLRSLTMVIENYPGKIYWSPKRFETNGDHHLKLAECIKEYYYKPYEKSFKTLFASVSKRFKAKETKGSLFCSELVARCLQKSNLLLDTVNPEKVVPLDFYKDPNQPNRTLDIHHEIPILYENPIQIKLY